MSELRSRTAPNPVTDPQSVDTRPRKLAKVALSVGAVAAVATGCINRSVEAPEPSDRPSATSSHPTTTTDTAPPTQERGPVPIPPDLCPVIPPEVTAAILKTSVDSSEFQAALDSCVGADASMIPNDQNLLASSMLMTTGSTGLYVNIYTEAQIPALEESAKEHDISLPEMQPLTVNGETGTYIPPMGLAEVPFQNGGQELYLNVNAGPDVPSAELEQCMEDVENAIFNPQTTQK